MAYQLSATKLQTYHQCPRAYYYQYERGLGEKKSFAAPILGKILHKALQTFFWDWHYYDPKPPLDWMVKCWESANQELSRELKQEGQDILTNYYYKFVASQDSLKKPLGVEGRINTVVSFHNVEFKIIGRYDRLDWFEDGLELIDYKSSKTIKTLQEAEMDLQLGLYCLALEPIYHCSLKKMSLLYLRQGEAIEFPVTTIHKQTVEQTIADIADGLRLDSEWKAHPCENCDRCTFRKYCSAVTEHPEPLPETAKEQKPLQLTLL